ncbi:hypothetical protein A9Q74_06925 [Colwellia sp. 39_35_sub15_T18]|nr:hypothetical protein A9Q74_06925 [Colwellia sp. 39_35_sub15_T18]
MKWLPVLLKLPIFELLLVRASLTLLFQYQLFTSVLVSICWAVKEVDNEISKIRYNGGGQKSLSRFTDESEIEQD